MRRNDQDDPTYFRSGDRVFCLNGKWYYQTRETDHGPYPTRNAAEHDLQRYINEMEYLDGVAPEDTHAGTDEETFSNLSVDDKDPD
jgi:hypothetical protein